MFLLFIEYKIDARIDEWTQHLVMHRQTMPTLSGLTVGGGGDTSVTLNVEQNNLVIDEVSFRGIGADTLSGEVVNARRHTTAIVNKSTADSADYWNVAQEIARCRRVIDLYDDTRLPPTPTIPRFTFEGTLALTLRCINGCYRIWADVLKGTLEDGAQPNITQVGTLTDLNVSGTTTSNNCYANDMFAQTFSCATVTSPLRMNDNAVGLGTTFDDYDRLRTSGKGGISTSFAGVTNLNGVVLYGQAGGMLGGNMLGVSTSERCALRWWASGANASVGINTTASPRGALEVNGDAHVVGRIYGAGNVTSGTNLPQGYTIAWNFSGGLGETDFLNKSGSGVGGYRFYNSTGDNTPFSTGQNLLAILSGDGLTCPTSHIVGRTVFGRVQTVNFNFGVPNNVISLFANSTGGALVTHDLRPPNMAVGGFISPGGLYRVPVAGHYEVRVTGRFSDGAGGQKGVIMRRWDGTTATNLLVSDGWYFCSDDGAGRRMFDVSDVIQCAQFNELYVTQGQNAANNVLYACMTIRLISLL